MRYFISGHLDISEDEFNRHYKSKIDMAIDSKGTFVIGDAKGVDFMAASRGIIATVYHTRNAPLHYVAPHRAKGGYANQNDKNAAMTAYSDSDIA